MFEQNKVMSVVDIVRGVEWLQKQMNTPDSAQEARAIWSLLGAPAVAVQVTGQPVDDKAESSAALSEEGDPVYLSTQFRNKRLILPLILGTGKHCWVCAEERGVSVGFTGGTTYESDSDPVYLKFLPNAPAPTLYAWSNINQSEPTMVCDLRCATEPYRRRT